MNINFFKRITLILSIILLFSACGNLYVTDTDSPKAQLEVIQPNSLDSSETSVSKEPVSKEKVPVVDEPIIIDEHDTSEIKSLDEDDSNKEPDSIKETTPIEETNSLDDFVFEFTAPKDLAVDTNTLDNTSYGWSFRRNKDHSPVTAYNKFDIAPYGGYFINSNTEEKVVYLTFDEGYENGFTPKILDTLKSNNIHATFFITGAYIDKEPDLVKRMVDEGHIVGNHSEHHPDMTSKSDDEVKNEILSLASKFENLTGKSIAPFFRPPMGKYSKRTLYLTRELGYRTIFWSMAYKDWDTNDQPGKQASYDHVMNNYHPGALILLHAVSESNTEALDNIIKSLKEKGYRFGSLYEFE